MFLLEVSLFPSSDHLRISLFDFAVVLNIPMNNRWHDSSSSMS